MWQRLYADHKPADQALLLGTGAALLSAGLALGVVIRDLGFCRLGLALPQRSLPRRHATPPSPRPAAVAQFAAVPAPRTEVPNLSDRHGYAAGGSSGSSGDAYTPVAMTEKDMLARLAWGEKVRPSCDAAVMILLTGCRLMTCIIL